MPRRKRAQEPVRQRRRAERRAARITSDPRVVDEEDLAWTDHEYYESLRRVVDFVPRPRQPFDIRPVVDAVVSDFAKWKKERESNDPV